MIISTFRTGCIESLTGSRDDPARMNLCAPFAKGRRSANTLLGIPFGPYRISLDLWRRPTPPAQSRQIESNDADVYARVE